MPPAVAAAAAAQGIGASEFVRRAVIQALGGGSFRVETRKPRGPYVGRPRRLGRPARCPETDGSPPPPPPAAPVALTLPAAA